MDYEKKYNEALERARANYKADKEMGFLENCDMLELIFPELRESEDERIRRMIGLALTDVPEERFTSLGTTLKDCLAYLEKQKEQKPAWSEEDEKVIRDAYCWIAEYAGFLVSENKDKAEMLWKLSEKLKSLRPQPKQEWSEEDRLHYANILEALEYVKGCKSDYDKIEAVKSDIAWLKSLPLNLKKKNEDVAKLCSNDWSEEDEKIMQTMIKEGDLKPSEISWLKSLRPSWKPSEEQMYALHIVLDIPTNDEDLIHKQLRDLYNDLKKLKEDEK